MQHTPATAPGGPYTPTSVVTAAARAVTVGYLRPLVTAPTDGTAPPPAPVVAPPAGGPADGGGQAPPADPLGVGGAQPPTAAPPAPVPPPPPATPPAAPPAGPPGSAPAPAAGGAAVAGDRSLDQFPPEIRDYIAELRKEAGDNRVKAKTAETAAAEQMKTWLDGIARTFGLIQDSPDVPPEQQIEKLGQQLATTKDEHRDTRIELGVLRTAHTVGADPVRLTDSRAFMRKVAGLDPDAPDFAQQVATAIGTALAENEHYRAAPPAGQTPPAAPPGQVPPPAPPAAPPAPVPLPPVPSGGDFAGGTGSGATEPQTVDQFRDVLREHRRNSR